MDESINNYDDNKDKGNEERAIEPSPSTNVVEETKKEKPKAEIAEIIEELGDAPPDVRKTFQALVAMTSERFGPAPNPLFSKFNDEHIHKYLDYVQRDDDHNFELKRTNRIYYLIYFIITLVVFAAAVVYLYNRDRDLLMFLLQIIVLLAGGIGAGYGLAKRGGE